MLWTESVTEWVADGKPVQVGLSRYGSGPEMLLLPALSSISTRDEFNWLITGVDCQQLNEQCFSPIPSSSMLLDKPYKLSDAPLSFSTGLYEEIHIVKVQVISHSMNYPCLFPLSQQTVKGFSTNTQLMCQQTLSD